MSTGAPARLIARGAALAPNVRGALWALAAAGFMSCMAVLVKTLGRNLPSLEVSFFRALLGLVIIAPFVVRGGLDGLRTKRPGLNLLRASLGAVAMMAGFYALTKLPLALATSLSFARPLFMVVLAMLFLGEVVRVRRWTATLVGFCGVIVILRPTAAIEPAALIALGGALLVAMVMVLTKLLAPTERPATLILYSGVISTLATLAPAIFVWRTPTLTELALLLLMGVVGTLGSACIIRALRAGEATVVTPVEYVRILFAGAFGYVLFAEVPDAWTWLGAAIIVGSTLYITVREARLGRQRPPPADA